MGTKLYYCKRKDLKEKNNGEHSALLFEVSPAYLYPQKLPSKNTKPLAQKPDEKLKYNTHRGPEKRQRYPMDIMLPRDMRKERVIQSSNEQAALNGYADTSTQLFNGPDIASCAIIARSRTRVI